MGLPWGPGLFAGPVATVVVVVEVEPRFADARQEREPPRPSVWEPRTTSPSKAECSDSLLRETNMQRGIA